MTSKTIILKNQEELLIGKLKATTNEHRCLNDLLQIWLKGIRNEKLSIEYVLAANFLSTVARSEKDNNEFKAQLEELISKYLML